MKVRRAIVSIGAACAVSFGLLADVPAKAHGTGVVKSCKPNTDCTTNSNNNAVFAICNPAAGSPTTTCNPGRQVTVRLSNFGSSFNGTVYLWWLNGAEATNPTKTDCTKAVDAETAAGLDGRTFLAPVSMTNGTGRWDGTLPPAGGTPDKWQYGANWLCATTAAATGQNGTVGDQQFAIYPA